MSSVLRNLGPTEGAPAADPQAGFQPVRWQLDSVLAAPAWLQRAFDMLQRQSAAGLASDSAQPAALLQLEPATPGMASSAGVSVPTAFLLTDDQGRLLHPRWPLLHDITAGRGVGLVLWQWLGERRWQRSHQTRLAAGHRWAEGGTVLARALVLLLEQVRRQDLGAAASTTPVGSGSPDARSVSAAQPLTAPQVWACRWAGAWRAWRAVQRSRLLREEWRIGVVDAPVHRLLQGDPMPPPRWLSTPPGLGYWADPMGLGLQHDHLVCEYYSELTGLGQIESLALGPDGEVVQRQVLPMGAGKHASFPLLVQIDGRLLGIAETAALRECVIHEVDAQGQWHPIAATLKGIAAADPVLFQWQGLYWLAYTDIDVGEMDNLCLQSAPSLQGPWTPHPRNPVKIDIGGARMAGGMLLHQGALYRPGQNCLGAYGAAVQIYRIRKLTATEFEEEPVRSLVPDPDGPCPDGLHTLSAWGERTLIDGKRYVFSPSVVWWKVRRRLGRTAAP